MDVCLLSHKELTPRVQVEDTIKVFGSDIFKLVKVLDTSVGAYDIKLASKCSFSLYEKFFDCENTGVSFIWVRNVCSEKCLLWSGFEISALIATALPPARSIASTTFSAGAALRE